MFALTAAVLVMAPTPAVTPVDFRLADQPARVTGLASTTPPGTPIPLAPLTTTEGSSQLKDSDARDDQAPLRKPRFGRGAADRSR